MVDDNKKEPEEIWEEHTTSKKRIFSIITKNKWFILSLVTLFTLIIIFNNTNHQLERVNYRLSNLIDLSDLSDLSYLKDLSKELTDIDSSIEDITFDLNWIEVISHHLSDINIQLDGIRSELISIDRRLIGIEY